MNFQRRSWAVRCVCCGEILTDTHTHTHTHTHTITHNHTPLGHGVKQSPKMPSLLQSPQAAQVFTLLQYCPDAHWRSYWPSVREGVRACVRVSERECVRECV
jgi:hypothetical protein